MGMRQMYLPSQGHVNEGRGVFCLNSGAELHLKVSSFVVALGLDDELSLVLQQTPKEEQKSR